MTLRGCILAFNMLSKPARPVGITLLAIVFLWIGCLGTLFFPLFLFFPGGMKPLWKLALGPIIHSPAAFTFISWLLTGIWFSAYVAYAFIGFGLLKLRNWARIGVLVVCGLGMGFGLVATAVVWRHSIAFASPVGFWCVLPFAWIGWYCLRPGVRYAFGAWPINFDGNNSAIPPPSLPTKARVVVGVLAGATTFGLFLLSLMFAVEAMMHSSEAFQMALDIAQRSPCVVNAIGTPLKPGWFVSGSTNSQGSTGSAELSVPVRGPKGKGDLNLQAKKVDGAWHIISLEFEGSNGRLKLIPGPAGAACDTVNPTYR